MYKAGPVLSLLRNETGDIHGRLEGRMDAIDRFAAKGSRDDLVRRYHQFHTVMEAAMAPALAALPAGPWRRGRQIEESLVGLGLAPLPCPKLALFDDQQALGALYVLEGSALGGRVILKDLARRGVDCRSLQFLDPHGEHIAARWRAVADLIEREARSPERLIDGAMTAFAQAHEMLCLEGQPA